MARQQGPPEQPVMCHRIVPQQHCACHQRRAEGHEAEQSWAHSVAFCAVLRGPQEPLAQPVMYPTASCASGRRAGAEA